VLTLLLLVPLAGILILNLPFKRGLRALAWEFAVVLAILQIGLVVVRPAALCSGANPLETFFTFGLKADNLSLVFLLSTGIVLLAALLVGQSTLTDEKKRFHFVNVLLIAMIGMNGTVLLTDLFSLYVFMEITSVASFILIALNRDKPALEGAFKYIILSAVATVLLVTSIALLLLVMGDTSFESVRAALVAPSGNVIARVAMGAFICGLFIKAGLVPFHGWVADAYGAAPAAVSVLLAGIATKASGIYALIRVVAGVFSGYPPLNHVLLAVGVLTIIVGALAALAQSDLKRLLAYSSVSQMGYIVLGLGCGTPLGLLGALFHVFNHATFKSLLFVNSAAVEQRTGTTDMRRLGGLGSRMPCTGATSVVAALSTAGIPPLAGFWSKLLIVVALWQAHYYGYAVAAILLSVLTLAYLLTMQRKVFFGTVPEEWARVREASPVLVIASVVLAAITVGAGLAFPWVFWFFQWLPGGGL